MDVYVNFDVDEGGYWVSAQSAGGHVVEEYVAGNHALDSQVTVPPSSPWALGLPVLQAYAKSTAEEMAAELEAKGYHVVRAWQA